MKATQRRATTAAGFLALGLAGAPAFGQSQTPAQRGGPPGQDTPYILITTFQSADRPLAVQTADEVRKRVQGEHAAKELYVIPKTSIDNTLTASGYRPDSALNASDLMELSKQLHGEYVLDGTVSKTPGGVRLESRILMRTGPSTLTQPLPAVDGKDAGDVAKGLERVLSDALKGMPAYKVCTGDLRALKYDQAQKDARTGMAAYPNSSLNRLCLLSAYGYQKAPPDSIISAANSVLAIDKTSLIALSNLADAYAAKGDSAKVIETNLAIYRADPTNQAVVKGIIQALAQSGAPDKALPIIDSLLKDNPADPELLRTKWIVQLRAKEYKQAIATGEELVKIDTGAANLDYYNRQIGAAQSDSNTAAVQMLAAKASQKFPTDATFPLLLAQIALKGGQAQQAVMYARRATTIDPKNSNAWLFAVVAASQANMSDSVTAWAPQAIAAGVDKSVLSNSLLQPVSAAVKKAQESKDRADWESALKAAESADAMAKSPGTQFYVGLSSFQIALDAINNAQKLGKSKDKSDKAKACEETKVAEDNAAKTAVAMSAGGSYNKEAGGQIMAALSQVQDAIPQFKKAYCK